MPPIPTTSPRPFIPAVGIVQVEMVYDCLDQTCENVYHASMGDGAPPASVADMTDIAVHFEAWEHLTAAPMRNHRTVLDHIIVRDLSTESGPAILHNPTTSVTGGGAGVPLPNNVTAAVKWNTALRGRSFRGRTYHIGLENTQIIELNLTASMRDLLVSVYSDLMGKVVESAAFGLVVLSYAHNKFWRDAAVATPVVGVSCDSHLDSQRRRLFGRGT